jgi:IS30 family transposase
MEAINTKFEGSMMGVVSYVKRIDIIKQMLLEDKTHLEIAKVCGVHRVTITRDFKRWRQSEDFESWLVEEYLRLHGHVKNEDRLTAYRVVSKLLAKTLVAKHEMKGKVDLTIRGYGLGEKRPESKSD